MINRAVITTLILSFWLVMMGLLVQDEFFPERHKGGHQLSTEEIVRRKAHLQDDGLVEYDIYSRRTDQENTGDQPHGKKIGELNTDVSGVDKLTIRSNLNLSFSPQMKISGSQSLEYDEYLTLQNIDMNWTFQIQELGEMEIVGEGTVENGTLSFGLVGQEEQLYQVNLNESDMMATGFQPLYGPRIPEPGESGTIEFIRLLKNERLVCDISTSAEQEEKHWQNRTLSLHRVEINCQETDLQITAWQTEKGDLVIQDLNHPSLPGQLRKVRKTPLNEEENGSE